MSGGTALSDSENALGQNQQAANRPVVWSIAGSDSSGGAGIQADLLTMQDLGVHGATAITAVTAQNSVEVSGVLALAWPELAAQLEALAEDLPPRVIKIGLLASSEQVRGLAGWLAANRARLGDPEVIYDPVALASSGQPMTVDEIGPAVLEQLLPQVDLLTPNAAELEALSGISLLNAEQLWLAIDKLLGAGTGGVLLKGGHLTHLSPDTAVDLYSHCASNQFDAENLPLLLASPRQDTPHGHGSGCTLASAIASARARDYPLEDALVLAKAYVNRGLAEAAAVGRGPAPLARTGWPRRRSDFPKVVLPGSPLGQCYGLPAAKCPDGPFASCPSRLGLYPVVNSVAWLERLLESGVRTLQLRIKDRRPEEVDADIAAAVALGRRYRARLFINDYWQLAIRHGAYGVHLGQEDLQTADLAAIQAAGLRLGLSTHGYCELLRAAELKPSYLALGHIFPTRTKQMPSRPQGLTRLADYAALMADWSLVAIGGIKLEHAPEVLATGVGSIAVVTAITEAKEPQQAIARWLELVGRGDDDA